MFMLKSTHRDYVEALRAGHRIVVQDQARTIAALRQLLAQRQVRATRNAKSGRFEKREG